MGLPLPGPAMHLQGQNVRVSREEEGNRLLDSIPAGNDIRPGLSTASGVSGTA